MPTLLHISDLHRTAGPRLTNDVLFAALASDARRWESEGIPRPDLVVVSGDLIQGASVDVSDPDSEICAQYIEAGELLCQLATEFTGSDRSRIIVVPGNHDVHWARARSGMNPLEECPTRIAVEGFEAGSRVRWDWETQRAFEITDMALYESRLEHFRRFQAEFYKGIERSPLIGGISDIVFAEYPEFGLVVVGFASWHGNDCFCHVGDIDPSALAQSRTLLGDSRQPVAAAVWHHGIVGGPRDHDYMDAHVVHRLIDFGFSVGLHGHQHYAGAAPYQLRLPNLTSMAIVGAGSLAVGDDQLPMGERRQFNLVVIEPEKESITVHVRGMSSGEVFSALHREDFGGKPHMQLELPISSARPGAPTTTQLLDEAVTAVSRGDFQTALDLLPATTNSHDSHTRRQVMIQALDGLGDVDELLTLLAEPQSADEVVQGISVCLANRRFDKAIACLDAGAPLLDRGLARELAGRIAAERTIS